MIGLGLVVVEKIFRRRRRRPSGPSAPLSSAPLASAPLAPFQHLWSTLGVQMRPNAVAGPFTEEPEISSVFGEVPVLTFAPTCHHLRSNTNQLVRYLFSTLFDEGCQQKLETNANTCILNMHQKCYAMIRTM